jgi:hypothetical protein
MEQVQALLPNHTLERSEEGKVIFDGKATKYIWHDDTAIEENTRKEIGKTMTELHGPGWKMALARVISEELARPQTQEAK